MYECNTLVCTVRDKKMWIFIMFLRFHKQNRSAVVLLTFSLVLNGRFFLRLLRECISYFDKLFMENQ